jgi:hypothetical protein
MDGEVAKEIGAACNIAHPLIEDDVLAAQRRLYEDWCTEKELHRKKDEELRRKDEELRRKDEELRRKTRLIYVRSVGILWDMNVLRTVQFIHVMSKSTYESQSPPVHELLNCSFAILPFEPSDKRKSLPSITQAYFQNKSSVHFTAEASIVSFIRNIIKDALALCDFARSIITVDEASMAGAGGRSRTDMLVIDWNLAVEGKAARRDQLHEAVTDLAVSGQLYDYLVDLQMTFGSRPLGILSDGRFWRICWLPTEDDIVLASSLEAVQGAGIGALWNAEDRRLCASPVYDVHDTADLMHVLVTTLLKSSCTVRRPVALLSDPKRFYAAYSKDTWSWKKLRRGAAMRPLEIKWPRAGSLIYALSSRSTRENFALIATDGWGALFVAKVFLKMPDCDDIADLNAVTEQQKEKEAWLRVWNIEAIDLTLASDPALIIPFVVPVASTYGYSPTIPASSKELLTSITRSTKCFSDDDITLVEPLFATLVEAGLLHHTPQSVLEAAVADLASRRLVHPDIDWHHVGLLLQPANMTRTIRSHESAESKWTLRPVLIDLEGLHEVPTEAEAVAAMRPTVEALIAFMNTPPEDMSSILSDVDFFFY